VGAVVAGATSKDVAGRRLLERRARPGEGSRPRCGEARGANGDVGGKAMVPAVGAGMVESGKGGPWMGEESGEEGGLGAAVDRMPAEIRAMVVEEEPAAAVAGAVVAAVGVTATLSRKSTTSVVATLSWDEGRAESKEGWVESKAVGERGSADEAESLDGEGGSLLAAEASDGSGESTMGALGEPAGEGGSDAAAEAASKVGEESVEDVVEASPVFSVGGGDSAAEAVEEVAVAVAVAVGRKIDLRLTNEPIEVWR